MKFINEQSIMGNEGNVHHNLSAHGYSHFYRTLQQLYYLELMISGQ